MYNIYTENRPEVLSVKFPSIEEIESFAALIPDNRPTGNLLRIFSQ